MKVKFKVGDRVKLRYVAHGDIFSLDYDVLNLLEQKGTVTGHDSVYPRIKFDNGTVEFFVQNQLVKLKKKVK